MFKSVRFDNFKGLKQFTVTLKEMNVLVGPNNAGKSTVLDGCRALSAAEKFAGSRNPSALSVNGSFITGWDIPLTQIPISVANIHSDYQDDVETAVTSTFTSWRKLRLSFYENSNAVLAIEDNLKTVRNIADFRKSFPILINSTPTLGPLEEEENLLTYEYVERWRGSRITHRMFSNIWYRKSEQFSSFRALSSFRDLVESTLPGMSIRPPERHGYAPPKLTMFCEENRLARELSWAGFGVQVWLQILTQLIGASAGTTLIVDEPESTCILIFSTSFSRFYETQKNR